MIIGDQYAYVYYYKNEGTNDNPVFNNRDSLRLTTGSYIHEQAGLRPCCTDYNNDGAIDLLTSDYNGYIRFYENTVFPGVEEIEQAFVTNFTIAPNLTKDRISLRYSLIKKSFVSIEVYSADGRLVDVVISRFEDAGEHQLSWNRGNLTSGVYFFKLNIDASTTTKKIIIL